jgi:hypothetical protein
MPEERAGMTVRCPRCARKFTVGTQPKESSTTAAALATAPAGEDADGDQLLDADPEMERAAGPASQPQPPSPALHKEPPRVERAPYRPPVPIPVAKKKRQREEDDDEVNLMPAWASPWGLAAFGFGVLGLFLAAIVQIRLLTVVLAALGLAALTRGWVVTKGKRQTKDQVWLSLGGVLCGGLFLLSVFAPGILNHRWAIDTAVARIDPNKLEVAARGRLDEKKPLTADDWVDAATEVIFQHDAVVRLESVKVGPLEDKGAASYLLVHFRLVNIGREQIIKFQGFSNPSHLPVLKDNSGRSYAFLEQRPRMMVAGPEGQAVSGPPARGMSAGL